MCRDGNAVMVRRMGHQRLTMRAASPLAGRLACWLGTDGNPLRRRTDRIESALRLLLVLAFVAASPLLAGLAGRWAQAMELQRLLWRINEIFARFNLAACIKAALDIKGYDVGDPVPPVEP